VAAIEDPERTSIAVVYGIAGSGKTTLARRAAEKLRGRNRFPGGEYRLEMKGLEADSPPLEVLLRALLAEIGVPTQASGDALPGVYRDQMAKGPTLILADNTRDAEQVRDLVPLPPSALIVTARKEVRLRGAAHVRLRAWTRDELQAAAALLAEVCKGEREQELSADEARKVVEACGGLPIAVRAAGLLLAGPLQPSVEEVVNAIRNRRGALNDGETDVDATLALTVEALERLSPRLVRAWRRLSFFPGDFDAPAAAAVMGTDTTSAQRDLRELIGHSIVEPGDKTGRFRLHDLYRALASAQMDAAESNGARLAFAIYFGKWVAACPQRFEQKDGQMEALAAFDRERANIEAGWAAANALGKEQEAARALLNFGAGRALLLYIRLSPRVLAAWADAALEASRRLQEPKAEARAYGALGVAHQSLRRVSHGHRESPEAPRTGAGA
jgi:hypothetical protein